MRAATSRRGLVFIQRRVDVLFKVLLEFLFLKDVIYLFLERGKERERNIDVREKHPSVALVRALTMDLAHNPGMCPDWEQNQ